jgi:hypothetical protein
MSASTTHARATAVNLDTPVRGSLMINGLENDLILGSDGNIFTIRADGSNKTYLTQEGPEVINHLASWSYDGTKIVYTRGESTPFGRIQPYIWTMNADGTDKKQLTFHPLSGSSPTFSPDGQSILFTTHAGSALADDPLSKPPANGRWMGLSFVVEVGDSVRDGAGESVGIGEGTISEIMLLEVTPASLDIIQFGGVFR